MKFIFILSILIAFISCSHSSNLPIEKYPHSDINITYTIEKQKSKIEIGNILHCPVRVELSSPNKEWQTKLNRINPILLKSKEDTVIFLPNVKEIKDKIRINYLYGNLSKKIKHVNLELPFPKGKKYRIIQGNKGDHSHYSHYSKYALDFHLNINDTICSATDGFVIGVTEEYKYGGEGDEWRDFANYITIYDPYSGIFTQYVHLVENGSLVDIGDKVKRGQPIGLAGSTGQSDMEHLHFNTLIPSSNGLKSAPYTFIEGYNSIDLKRDDYVKK